MLSDAEIKLETHNNIVDTIRKITIKKGISFGAGIENNSPTLTLFYHVKSVEREFTVVVNPALLPFFPFETDGQAMTMFGAMCRSNPELNIKLTNTIGARLVKMFITLSEQVSEGARMNKLH